MEGVIAVLFLMVFIVWIVGMAMQGVKSVGRTTKAIGKWNDEKLGK